MPAPSSPPPTRVTSGSTTDWPYGPLADNGAGNPFFYHSFSDDFDNALGATGMYTITAAGGSVAHTAGDGGLALFTTGAVSTNFAEIQLPAADFTIPQGTLAGKKMFYLTRLQMSDVSASVMIAGMCNITATPFTAVADGIYFQKANGVATLNIISVVGSVPTTTAIPGSVLTLVNGVNVDLGWYIDRSGFLNVFVSPNMVGYVPESGSGANLPTRGRIMQIQGLTLTTANLSPTLAFQTQAASAKTMTVDFHGAWKER